MQRIQVFTSRRNRRLALGGIAVFATGIIALYILIQTYFPIVFHPEEVKTVVQRFGLFAPLIYILVHIVQVLVMALPGYALAVGGGYLFGPVAGISYTMIGVTIGSSISFLLARRYGRQIVEQMILKTHIQRFDNAVQSAGAPGLLLFVLVPIFPEDVLCWLAGLAHYRFRVFVVVMFLGRLPPAVITVSAGNGIAAGHLLQTAVWVSSFLGIALYTYYYRKEILDRVGKLRTPS